MKGIVRNIFISDSAGAQMHEIKTASLEAGKGIKGDRYYKGNGTFSEMLKGKPLSELSLIEIEQVDYFNEKYSQSLSYSDLRRNIITQGINLNNLVGKTFTIGDTTLKGIKLCEPCSHLAETVCSLVLPHMIGRGGLRAQILSSGTIRSNDEIAG